MKVRYSPCKNDVDTVIEFVDENTVKIDGEVHEFDPSTVQWPAIAIDSGFLFLDAHRELGELFLTIRRFYTGSCSAWDTGAYWVLP